MTFFRQCINRGKYYPGKLQEIFQPGEITAHNPIRAPEFVSEHHNGCHPSVSSDQKGEKGNFPHLELDSYYKARDFQNENVVLFASFDYSEVMKHG